MIFEERGTIDLGSLWLTFFYRKIATERDVPIKLPSHGDSTDRWSARGQGWEKLQAVSCLGQENLWPGDS